MSMEIGEQSEAEIYKQYRISCSQLLVQKYKRMLSEQQHNSSTDSNSSGDSDSSPPEKKHKRMYSKETDSDSSTHSSGSPPHKRHCGPLFPISYEDLLKIDVQDILSKDYVDWFFSLGAEVDENEILWPQHYTKWFSTLGPESKADVVESFLYVQWYVEKFVPPHKFPTSAVVIKNYGDLALEYYNENNKCDYEYVRDVELNDYDDSSEVKFYGRLKVSPSRPESEAPQRLFFAKLNLCERVLECRLLDTNEFGDASVQHPPDDTYCEICSE